MPREKTHGSLLPDRDATAALGLMLLAAVPYLNSLNNSFVYDDRLQIVGNPYAHNFKYLGKIFGSTVWTFEGAQGVTNYYRPLMTFSYLVGYKLFGLVPFGFHMMSLVLHIGVVLLLFQVTEQLFADRLLSLIAAGLFALHPIHTESVAWIAAITDLQLSFFFLLTFLLYLRLDRPGNASGASWLPRAGMLATYVLALMSKEQALMFPVVAAIYEHFYRPGRAEISPGVKIRRYAPLCVIAAAYIAFRTFGLGGFAPSVSRPDLTLKEIFLSAVALVGGYLRKLVWPTHLTAFYVFHTSESWRDPEVLAGFAGLLACLILFLWLWRSAHTLSFSLLWMGVTLGPTLNARWMPAGVFAERYLYLPSVGFCWLVAAAAVRLWRGRRSENSPQQRSILRQAIPVALAVVALVYGIATVRRNRDWRTENILYTRTLEEQPNAQLIRTNLGVNYWDADDIPGAEREWMKAMEGPHDPYVSTMNNLGMLRAWQERYPEAIDYLQEVIDERPLYSSAYKNLADTYAYMGKNDDADRQYRDAVALSPLSTEIRNDYAEFLVEQGREAEARQQYLLSEDADPNGEAEEGLGEILAGAGEVNKAKAYFLSALGREPFNEYAHFGLGKLYEKQGQLSAAAREYRAGLETDPTNTEAKEALERLTSSSDSR